MKGRRTVKDLEPIPFRRIPEVLHELILKNLWAYKMDLGFYRARDRAFSSLAFLTGGRVSEVCQVKKKQFDFDTEQQFILIRNFQVLKRKKGKRVFIDLPLPNSHKSSLYHFTELFLDYWDRITERDKEAEVFKFERRRAWQIVNAMTGLFPHAFRSYCFSYWINVLKSETIIAKIFGVENPRTLSHYYKGTWKDFKDAFLS